MQTVPKLYSGKKIDLHTHIGEFGGWANVSLTPNQLIESMRSYNVERSAVYFTDNALVRKAVRRYPKKLVGVVWPDPREKGSSKLVKEALTNWGFKAVKLHPLFQAFLPNDEIVHPIVEEARKAGAPVLIHTGHSPFSLPWSVGELAENFRDVKIVMLHMGDGHGLYIQGAINTAKRYDNIYLETSAMPMATKIKEAVNSIGVERVMYGSDIPFGNPAVEILKMSSVDFTASEFEHLFYLNAKTVLSI